MVPSELKLTRANLADAIRDAALAAATYRHLAEQCERMHRQELAHLLRRLSVEHDNEAQALLTLQSAQSLSVEQVLEAASRLEARSNEESYPRFAYLAGVERERAAADLPSGATERYAQVAQSLFLTLGEASRRRADRLSSAQDTAEVQRIAPIGPERALH